VVLILRDETFLAHATQYIRATLPGQIGICDRVVARGQAERSRDQRDLGQRQLIDRLAEIHLGRGADAVRALTEEHLVDVEREDLLLRELLLDAQREED